MFKCALGSTHPSFSGYQPSSLEKSVWGVKFNIHLHQVPRLWMSGGIPLVPLYAFVACTGTSLPLVMKFLCTETHCKVQSVCYIHADEWKRDRLTMFTLLKFYAACFITNFWVNSLSISLQSSTWSRMSFLVITKYWRLDHVGCFRNSNDIFIITPIFFHFLGCYVIRCCVSLCQDFWRSAICVSHWTTMVLLSSQVTSSSVASMSNF